MVLKNASSRRPQSRFLSAHTILLLSEYSLIVFLLWAVAVEQTKSTRPLVSQRSEASEMPLTSVAHAALPSHSSPGQHMPMQWQCQPAEAPGQWSGVTQVDLCPDPGVPIQIGTLRLHVCQHDFFQIAQAVNAVVAHLPAAETTTTLSETDPDPDPQE